MYNPNSIKNFFEEVHKEAAEAAQKVYDKHNEELLKKIKNQMGKNHVTITGMGTAFVKNTKGDDRKISDNEFFQLLRQNTQFDKLIEAGFSTPHTIRK